MAIELIMSGTDGSEGAERAVVAAADLAKAFNAKLLIVHVSKDVFSNEELRMLDRLRVAEGDALEELSRRILAKSKAVAKTHGASNIETMTGVETRRKCS